MPETSGELKNDLLSKINERQQISYNELRDDAFSNGVPEANLKATLAELEKEKAIASRSAGGMMTYYILADGTDKLRKVLIVEDDPNINKLMALSIGKEYDISQLYDGGQALPFIRKEHPDLVVLDLMLPNRDGLDICQTIKSDPDLKGTIVIIVSAMDPTSNRFKGIQYGADYYIKKPFDPIEVRSLVTLFLRKKGKRFDPLIDLPDEERISEEVEKAIKAGADNVMGVIKINNLAQYVQQFGEKSGIVILRLISQLLQDMVKDDNQNAFVGFLNNESFVIGGARGMVSSIVSKIKEEFSAVLPFILQDEGYKPIDVDIESLFEAKEIPKLSLSYSELDKESIMEKRNSILSERGASSRDIGSYTYEELQRLLESGEYKDKEFDIKITRDDNGVKINVGTQPKQPLQPQPRDANNDDFTL
ncbi:MAG: response regulator [Candidatus Marsarchaeota archaeon]|jgi:DNA-binding response OmpR family regulator|nr:response regulator [Candidatus Marsarchaeota archaeon]MCL5112705.1 response regulator [Candidatus Marsarchaeota archaeon]